MSDFHGIIFAYGSVNELGELVKTRTAASLPFCGRYRLIDFALSSMSNAGIRDVGVIMQRDYQSLLDHLGSGKAWDLSRRSGGLHLLRRHVQLRTGCTVRTLNQSRSGYAVQFETAEGSAETLRADRPAGVPQGRLHRHDRGIECRFDLCA